MIVHRPRLKAQGAVVTAVATLALGACTDPTARTDLRPDGPPDVLAVLVNNDSLNGLVESATFCKPNDEKRPGLVGLPDFTTTQICPDGLAEGASEITDASPTGWYVRVMFDELLDPNVEDLIPELDENNQETGVFTGSIAKTKPVTLKCEDFSGAMIDVDYDGYYAPSGNNVTWPLGPSLVVKPADPSLISVGSKCQILLKNTIKDKSGVPVPDSQLGPYTFKIAPVQVIAIGPADGDQINPEDGGIDVVFNTNLDRTSLCNDASDPALSLCLGADPTLTESKIALSPNVTNVGVFPLANNDFFIFGDLLDEAEYTYEIPAGTKFKDHCGKESTLPAPAVSANTKATFKTTGIKLNTVAPFSGTGIAPGRKISIDFNQLMDPTSIDASEFTITPTPQAAAFRSAFNGDTSVILLNGQFDLNTQYTFTLKQGATIRDAFDTKDFVIASEIQAKFTTAAAIALTASSPATGSTVTKGSAASPVSILLTFNQEMNPASFVAGTSFTLVEDASGAQVPVAVVNNPTNRSQIRFRSTTPAGGALNPGKYTFTFKAGAVVTDKVTIDTSGNARAPNMFTQAADRVIKFTVVEASPAPKCLGAP